nr:unnamed protein product [Escherichia coli K-12]
MLMDQDTEGGRWSSTSTLSRLRLRLEIVIATQLVITIVWTRLTIDYYFNESFCNFLPSYSW